MPTDQRPLTSILQLLVPAPLTARFLLGGGHSSSVAAGNQPAAAPDPPRHSPPTGQAGLPTGRTGLAAELAALDDAPRRQFNFLDNQALATASPSPTANLLAAKPAFSTSVTHSDSTTTQSSSTAPMTETGLTDSSPDPAAPQPTKLKSARRPEDGPAYLPDRQVRKSHPVLAGLLLLLLVLGFFSATPAGRQSLSSLHPASWLSQFQAWLGLSAADQLQLPGQPGAKGEPGEPGPPGANGATACLDGLCVSRQQDIPTLRELGHIHLSGSAAFGGNLDVGSRTTLYGALTVNDTTTLNEALTVTGNTTLGGTTTLSDILILNANVASHLIPNAGSTYDLGSSTNPWRNFYVDTLTASTLTTGFTSGSIIFADAAGNLSQDNSSLYWDAANKRLGVGTSAPLGPLHINAGVTPNRLIIEVNSATLLSALNLWNSDTGGAAGSGMVFGAGGDGLNTGFIGGVASQRIDAGTNSRTALRVLSNGTLTNVTDSAAFYLEGSATGVKIIANGNVGIGHSAPSSRLVVKGTTADSTVAGLNVINSSDSSLLYVRNDGNIGIGTTSPSSNLHIVSSSGSPVTSITVDSSATIHNVLDILVSGTSRAKILKNGQGSLEFSTSQGNHIILNPAGSVGIGNIAPDSRLVVKGTTADSTASGLNVTNSSDSSLLFVRNDGNVGIGTTFLGDKLHLSGGNFRISDGDPRIKLFETDTTDANYEIVANTSAFLFNQVNDSGAFMFTPFRIDAGAPTGSIRVLSSGNVGIGTANPNTKLHLVASSNHGLLITDSVPNKRAFLGRESGNGSGILELYDGSTTKVIALNANGDSYINTGNVGIGTTSPQKGLHVVNSEGAILAGNSTSDLTDKFLRFGTQAHDTTQVPFYAMHAAARSTSNDLYLGGGTSLGQAANTIIFYTASGLNTTTGTGRMTINSAGNIGIGTGTGINSKLTFAADTTAAGGILFGADTNLYRSAADVLKTDDSLDVGTRLSVGAITVGGAKARIYNDIGADKGLVIRGASGQTGNLQEWQDSSGGVHSSVSASGAFQAPHGGVTAGGIRFQGEVDTGLYLIGSGNLGITVDSQKIGDFKNNAGTLGIGFLGAAAANNAVVINGGLQLSTATAKPTCDSTTRGTLWHTQGGAGVKDSLETCAKDAADTYAWRTIY